MAKTLASQAKDGGSIPLARSSSPGARALRYQAWPAPQWGQPTVVDTGAVKT
jgi:hypothetical protein